MSNVLFSDKNYWRIPYDKLYVKNQGVLSISPYSEHHAIHFDRYVDENISNIIEQRMPIIHIIEHIDNKAKENIYRFEITIDGVTVLKPREYRQDKNGNYKHVPVYPVMKRLENSTYEADVLVDVTCEVIRERKDKTSRKQLINTITTKGDEKIHFFSTPVCIKSRTCNLHGKTKEEIKALGEDVFDEGGAYLIKGNLYTITAREKKTDNYIYINYDNDTKRHVAFCQSKLANDYKFSIPTNVMIDSNNHIFVQVGFKKKEEPIPLNIFMRALGVTVDEEIAEMIVYDTTDPILMPYIIPSLSYKVEFGEENSGPRIIQSEQEAQDYIYDHILRTGSLDNEEVARNKDKAIAHILGQHFLPHLGHNFIGEGVKRLKARHLAYMVRKLILIKAGFLEVDDRDNYGNKRIQLDDEVIGIITRYAYNEQIAKFNKDKRRYDELFMRLTKVPPKDETEGKAVRAEQLEVLKKIIRTLFEIEPNKAITKTIRKCLASDVLPSKGSIENSKKGIRVPISYNNLADSHSTFRKIVTQTPGVNANDLSRHKLQQTEHGYVCGVETAHNQEIGLHKYMTYFTRFTIYTDPEIGVYKFIRSNKKIMDLLIDVNAILDYKILSDCVKIFVNGKWDYCISLKAVNEFTKLMRNGIEEGHLDPTITIFFKHNHMEIMIFTDQGRLIAPAWIVDDGNKLRITEEILHKIRDDNSYKWDDFFRKHTVYGGPYMRYLSIHERQHDAVLAISPEDLIEKTKQGIIVNYMEISPLTQFSNVTCCAPYFNHNPTTRNNYHTTMFKQGVSQPMSNIINVVQKFNIMLHPQRPMVTTFMEKYVPSINGRNYLVAIATKDGRTREDSNVLNKWTVSSRLCNILSFDKTIEYLDKHNDKFEKPDKNKVDGYKNKNYNNLEPDGRPRIGSTVSKGDIIIGKVTKLNTTDAVKYKDLSKSYSKTLPGVIDYARIDVDDDDKEFMAVRWHEYISPSEGDKFSTRSGQKTTCSELAPIENLPYNEEGYTPDILMNPHSMVGRYTLGQIMEGMAGLYCERMGVFEDGTAFSGKTYRDLMASLKSIGLNEYGLQKFYDGRTGEEVECEIFMGPIYTHSLHHIASTKAQARSTGQMTNLHQPVGGKTRQGGIKVSTMAKDAYLVQPVPYIIRELLHELSDKYHVFVCEICGLTCVGNEEQHRYNCRNCGNNSEIAKVEMPWTANVLINLIRSMGFAVRIRTGDARIAMLTKKEEE